MIHTNANYIRLRKMRDQCETRVHNGRGTPTDKAYLELYEIFEQRQNGHRGDDTVNLSYLFGR